MIWSPDSADRLRVSKLALALQLLPQRAHLRHLASEVPTMAEAGRWTDLAFSAAAHHACDVVVINAAHPSPHFTMLLQWRGALLVALYRGATRRY